MKIAVVVVTLIALASSAPQSRKLFHEHFEDFVDIIEEEAGEDIEHVLSHYMEFEEFLATVEYIGTANFKELISEMESLPEFKAVGNFEHHLCDCGPLLRRRNIILGQHVMAPEDVKSFPARCVVQFMEDIGLIRNNVVEFLENDNIDILYFIDRVNEALEITKTLRKNARHEISGKDFNSFIKDVVNEYPKEKLAALYEQKKAEDEEFRVAVENLEGEEWQQLFNALWDSEVFQNEVQTLAENGIDVQMILEQVKAMFGQL